jgi:hypothetical protein
LHSKFVKKIPSKKAIWVSKPAEFDADFESAEKVAKNSCEKSDQRKSDRKWSFWMNFFSVFSTDSNSALNFAFYDTHIGIVKKCLPVLALFANFKDKIEEHN